MPSIFTDNFFDDFMGFPFERTTTRKAQDAVMRTDIKETESGYQLEMELPGFNKEDLNAKLEDGYLTITATHSENHDFSDKEDSSESSDASEKAPKERYLRRERFYGTYARRFFIGKYVTQADMKARFENGILTLTFPKEDQKKVEEAKYISIEG
jgi:HSP20 family molecular chaperone IbpA